MIALRARRESYRIASEILHPHIDHVECFCPQCHVSMPVAEPRVPRDLVCMNCHCRFRWPREASWASDLARGDEPALSEEMAEPTPIPFARRRSGRVELDRAELLLIAALAATVLALVIVFAALSAR
jgi:hypothetical protein